ncbi:MAG: hypothetical protein Q9227_003122 [Pyrenula ochraceoflavens]
MAVTRHTTGSSKPRIFGIIPTGPERKTTTTTTTTTTKRGGAGGRKRGPKTTTTGGGGVTKTKKAPATHHKRKPTLKDKVSGAVEKVVGKAERKPGKEGAGTKKMRGTDGKGARGRPKKVVAA